jgi:hypothetical protein
MSYELRFIMKSVVGDFIGFDICGDESVGSAIIVVVKFPVDETV